MNTKVQNTESESVILKKKPNIIVYGIVALFFCVAFYNVYSAYSEKKRVKAEQEVQRLEALELKQKRQRETERLAELEHARKLQKIEQQRLDSERAIQQSKLESQQRIALYEAMKRAKKQAREDEALQRRIESAREHKSIPEGIPGHIEKEILSSTYLTIRNNPKDFIGNYQPQSILNSAKLTKGGADGLMLFSMISTDLKAIEEVIEIGHDVNAQNKTGFTPLMYASAYNTSDVVLFLIEQGADKKTTEYLSEGNALHLAARLNPKPEVVEALVKSGIDVEAKDKDGNTPLLVAAMHNQNLQVVEKLIGLGADINVINSDGKVAYSYAYERVNKLSVLGGFEGISEPYFQSVINIIRP